jgi:hypothetical protein
MTNKRRDNGNGRRGRPANDAEPAILWRHASRFEPAMYRGYVSSTQTYFDRVFARWVCLLQIDLFQDDLGEPLGRVTRFYNLGNGERPRISRRSKYWAAWVRANGGPPKRGDRMSPQIFVRRFAKVRVGDTTKDFEQHAIKSDDAYSVVVEIVEWETGPNSQNVAVHAEQRNARAAAIAHDAAPMHQSRPEPGSGLPNTTQSKGGPEPARKGPPKASTRRSSNSNANGAKGSRFR